MGAQSPVEFGLTLDPRFTEYLTEYYLGAASPNRARPPPVADAYNDRHRFRR